MTQKVMTNDEAVIGSKKIFFAIIGPFGRYITNPRGTLVENVKKVKNQPTLLDTEKEKETREQQASQVFHWI
jgi:hypothetical protein